jgi:hypothetical protein
MKVYQVIEVFAPYGDLEIPKTTIVDTFSSRKKAKSKLEELVAENEKKKKAEERKGKHGYWNIYTDYSYIVDTLEVK